MIFAALAPYKWAAIAAAVASACAFSGYKGYAHGRDNVKQKWDKANVEAQQKASAIEAANRIVAQQASTTYQATIATLERRNAASVKQVRQAASAPLVCPAGGTFGDVRVPPDVLRVLISAGADLPANPASAP